MKVSFAVTVHNEGEYVQQILSQLHAHILTHPDDEVVVLDDFSDDPVTVKYLQSFEGISRITIHRRTFTRDFAEHKNYLNGLCKGDYIFQIDADETVAPALLENLHELLDANSKFDLFVVPRVNTVAGLTAAHIMKWGWQVNDKGWIQWPDYQTRLYRNTPDIRWVGAVHERISGFHGMLAIALPESESCALYHHKTIERQERQNALYDTIGR